MAASRNRYLQPQARIHPGLRAAPPAPSTVALVSNLFLVAGSSVALRLLLGSRGYVCPSWLDLTLVTAALPRILAHSCFLPPLQIQIHCWQDTVSKAAFLLLMLLVMLISKAPVLGLRGQCSTSPNKLLSLFCQTTHSQCVCWLPRRLHRSERPPVSTLHLRSPKNMADLSQHPGPGPFLPDGNSHVVLGVFIELPCFPIQKAAFHSSWVRTRLHLTVT